MSLAFLASVDTPRLIAGIIAGVVLLGAVILLALMPKKGGGEEDE